MASHRYTVILEPEEAGGYHAFCPALKGLHTYGATMDEAIANAREAIELYLEDLKASGEPVPVEEFVIQPVEVAA
jgi:predicted RNase H-like HicB family nuclease